MPDDSMNDHKKGYPALRRGRFSINGADYFLTLCAKRPTRLLGYDSLRMAGLRELQRLDAAGTWHLRCAVFMPDHIHLVVTLGASGSLENSVRLFKGRLTPEMRKVAVTWQPSFYDHRLRADEDLLPVFLYIFLNPYRANLCPSGQSWPGYYCSPEDWTWFGTMTNESLPEPDWLR